MTETENTENPKPEDLEADTPEGKEAQESADPETGKNETAASQEETGPGDDKSAEVADLKDRLLRTMAEMENLRKRSERERQDAAQYAITGFARDLLEVADNLRRALESLPDNALAEAEAHKPFIEGVEMTERTLLSAFEKHGIERFSPEGERFDHNLHEAMFEAPTNDHPNGTVVQVVQPGYKIKERLLRPARVGVARNTEAPKDQERVDKTV